MNLFYLRLLQGLEKTSQSFRCQFVIIELNYLSICYVLQQWAFLFQNAIRYVQWWEINYSLFVFYGCVDNLVYFLRQVLLIDSVYYRRVVFFAITQKYFVVGFVLSIFRIDCVARVVWEKRVIISEINWLVRQWGFARIQIH